jgi:large conductance mechanosensitive channel
MKSPIQLPAGLPKAPNWISEFRAFILRGSVVDLAVGIIIGAAFTGVVGSLVKDIFNPIIGQVIGGVDFSNVFIPFDGKKYPSVEVAKAAGAATLNIGLFLNAIIQFVIVAFVIFWVVKVLSRMKLADNAPPPKPAQEVLLSEIRDLLKARVETVAVVAPKL